MRLDLGFGFPLWEENILFTLTCLYPGVAKAHDNRNCLALKIERKMGKCWNMRRVGGGGEGEGGGRLAQNQLFFFSKKTETP